MPLLLLFLLLVVSSLHQNRWLCHEPSSCSWSRRGPRPRPPAGRGRHPPPSFFQLLDRQEQARHVPPAVTTNPGLLLGASLNQLSLQPTSQPQHKVDVLMANQQQMYMHQLQLLRKQQLEAAKVKVEISHRSLSSRSHCASSGPFWPSRNLWDPASSGKNFGFSQNQHSNSLFSVDSLLSMDSGLHSLVWIFSG